MSVAIPVSDPLNWDFKTPVWWSNFRQSIADPGTFLFEDDVLDKIEELLTPYGARYVRVANQQNLLGIGTVIFDSKEACTLFQLKWS